MNITLRQDAMNETFNDVRSLIRNVVWNFIRSHGGDFNEYEAEANHIFIKAYDNYDPKKAKFTTYLVNRIRGGLLDYIKRTNKYAKHGHGIISIEQTEFDCSDGKKQFYILDLLDEVTDDAKTILNLILDIPIEIEEDCLNRGTNGRAMKESIRRYMQKLGWTKNRIKETFKEITEVINAN